MIVVIVREQHRVELRQLAHRDRHGLESLRPDEREGDARGPHTGSVSTRQPSISSSTVECPSQVARSPLCGARCQASSGFSDGSGPCGTRRLPPQRKSLSEGMGPAPRGAGCVLRKRSPSQRGEAAMRSARTALDRTRAGFIPTN